MMMKRILPYYFFTMECFLLYTLLFILYMPQGEHPPLLPFLILFILVNVILHLCLTQVITSAAIILLGTLVSGLTAYLTGLGPISALFSVFFLFIRISAFIQDQTLWKEERSGLAGLFYLINVVVIFDSWVVDYPELNLLYFLPIAFTLFYSIGRYMQQMENYHQLRFLQSIVSSVFITFFLTGFITLLLPFVKWAFFGLLQICISVIGFLASPLLNLVEGKKLELKIIHAPKDDEDQGPRNKIMHKIAKYLHLAEIPGWVWLIILLIIFFVIFLILSRKKVLKREGNDYSALVEFERIPTTSDHRRKFPFFRQRSPHEHLRKLFFDLHQVAAKNNRGRFSHETVGEWFDRIGLTKNENLFLAYEKVRYGNVSFSKAEGAQFDPIFEELKHEIKNRPDKNNENH